MREGERCAAAGAWLPASAMRRSALEKTLKANGYTNGNLAQKIEAAAVDGVRTAARDLLGQSPNRADRLAMPIYQSACGANIGGSDPGPSSGRLAATG